MPTITFVTPPGRPSVLRAASSKHDAAQGREHSSVTEPVSPSTAAPEVAPLTFEKRTLPSLTTSPEPANGAFELPFQRLSLDQPPSSRAHQHTSDAARPSLLSAAIVSSGAQPQRSVSATNLGILRRDASQSDDRTSTPKTLSTDSTTHPPRSRLHFVEPHRDVTLHASSRHPHPPNLGTERPEAGQNAVSSTTSNSGRHAESAPRKRSLVIQEHADVLERAAERAARHASHGEANAPEQQPHARHTTRSRQHSASSAGEETASTRSSWAVRSSSRGSSVATSPTVASDADPQDLSDSQLAQPARDPKPHTESIVTPIFHSVRSDAESKPSAPPVAERKLIFVDPPAPPRDPGPAAVAPRPAQRPHSPRARAHAASDDDKHDGGPAALPSRRALAFAECPKPQRAARLSPAHAARRAKKLSASPAPSKLAYPQRLRGIRGTDPIRSPAPERVAPPVHDAADWEAVIHDPPSSEGSGYSEDEEDDDDDEDEEDDDDSHEEHDSEQDEDEQRSSSSSASDLQSASASGPASLGDTLGALRREEELDVSAGGLSSTRPQMEPRMEETDAGVAPTGRRHSTSVLLPLQTAGAMSPPRAPRASRSTQASPRQAGSRTGARLAPKDSLSHPMCFLPDAFEDSAPATPTEPDSDGYEAPRANLLHGWLSEGGAGSAASSRRASWQQPLSPGGLRGEVEAVPITLPPFRRSRERTAHAGVTSDDERASRSLGGNAAFIRESALGRSPAGLGASMPLDARQPMLWRHVGQVELPASGLGGYRRASHSMEPRHVVSAYTSPIGSYTRPVGKRAVSAAVVGRAPASVARPQPEEVRVATSPPRADAERSLMSQLRAQEISSGATTPGWISDGNAPSHTAGYWSERLASLAKAMSDELAGVANAN